LLKPELSMGLRKKWEESKMERLLRRKSLRQILEQPNGSVSEEHNQGMSADYIEYNLLSATQAYIKSHPLSTIVLEGNIYGMALSDNGYALLKQDAYMGSVNGCHYHKWELIPSDDCHLDKAWIVVSVLLLPMLQKEGLPGNAAEPVYTIVESEWNEIDKKGILTAPELLFNSFNN